jgi:hypothetical protein
MIAASVSSTGMRRWSFTDAETYVNQQARAIARFSDGSAIAVGYAAPQDLSKPRQLRIWKISPEGALLWKRDFGGITQAEAYDVIITDDRATVIGDVTWPDSTGADNGNTDGCRPTP